MISKLKTKHIYQLVYKAKKKPLIMANAGDEFRLASSGIDHEGPMKVKVFIDEVLITQP